MDFSIERDGKIVYYINGQLLASKISNFDDAVSTLEKIKELHHEKLDVFDLMFAMDPSEDQESLRECDLELTEIEFKLQEAWGFEKNAKFHRFWERPFCSCPKIDNEDAYPTGYYVKSGGCPLHGVSVIKELEDFNKVMPETDSDDYLPTASDDVKYEDYSYRLTVVYKDPLSYRIKSALEFLIIPAMIAVVFASVYLLVTNQEAIKEFAKYIIGA